MVEADFHALITKARVTALTMEETRVEQAKRIDLCQQFINLRLSYNELKQMEDSLGDRGLIVVGNIAQLEEVMAQAGFTDELVVKISERLSAKMIRACAFGLTAQPAVRLAKNSPYSGKYFQHAVMVEAPPQLSDQEIRVAYQYLDLAPGAESKPKIPIPATNRRVYARR